MIQSLDFSKNEDEPIQKSIINNENLHNAIRLLHNEKKILVNGSKWILIENQYLRLAILHVFADPDKQKILCRLSAESMTIPEIRKHIKMPMTSGYRKINSLIKGGFVVSVGKVYVNNKKVRKYRAIFEDVTTFMDKNQIIVQVRLRTRNNQVYLKNLGVKNGVFSFPCKLVVI